MEKIYKITELKSLCSEQGYKLAALEDAHGKRLQPFNNPKISLSKQFLTIQNRLKSSLLSEGIYFICCAQNINRAGDPDRYPIAKGKVTADTIKETIIHKDTPSVLTYEKALEMQNTIAELKNENKTLKDKVTSQETIITELNAELEGMEEGEEVEDGMTRFTKDGLPQLLPLLDRFFDLEDKKVSLKEKELELKSNGSEQRETRNKGKDSRSRTVAPGSKEHLMLIQTLFDDESDEKLGKELDKLKKANLELYGKVMTELELEEGESEEEEEEEEEEAT